jgi:hypothetical protein
VVFENFSSSGDTSFYLQPGETTVALLSHFAQGDVGNALSGGATARFLIQKNLDSSTIDVALATLPEPPARWLAVCLLLLLGTLSRRRRSADRPRR